MAPDPDGTASGEFFARRGRKLAEAMTSPSTIVATGAAAAVAIGLGAPVAIIGLAAAGAYGVKVAVQTGLADRRLRKAMPEGVDLKELRSPYRDWVLRGIAAKDRFTRSVGAAPTGPLRSRLENTGRDIDDVLEGLGRIAQRAQNIEDYLSQPSTQAVEHNLSVARERLEHTDDADLRPERMKTVASLEEQSKVAARMTDTHERTMTRIESTVVSLDQLGAQVAEVLLAAEDASVTTGGAPTVDDLVADLHATREAVAELDPAQAELTRAELAVQAAVEASTVPRSAEEEPA